MKLEIVSLGLIFFSIIVITLGIIKIHTYPGKIVFENGDLDADLIVAVPPHRGSFLRQSRAGSPCG